VVFTLGTIAVGFAAMNTGNNLLYLLLGSMLGFIVVSGWLSEQAIRGLHVERRVPRAVTVGHDLRLTYDVTNVKRHLPSLAVEISEVGLPDAAFLPHVAPGGHATTRSVACRWMTLAHRSAGSWRRPGAWWRRPSGSACRASDGRVRA